MPVLGLLSYSLEVPSLEEGIKFYTDAGLECIRQTHIARFRCIGQSHDCVTLLETAHRKRLHHITLRADRLEEMGPAIGAAGGEIVSTPQGFEESGIWITDPHGVLFNLRE